LTRVLHRIRGHQELSPHRGRQTAILCFDFPIVLRANPGLWRREKPERSST
jgi:hypothetical protein